MAFAEHGRRIRERLPNVEVGHTGGTSVRGVLTSGDVDLHVRTDRRSFLSARDVLCELYEPLYPEAWHSDGKTILFERFFSTQRQGVDTEPVPKRAVLLLMRPDGSHKRVLRHRGAIFEYDASFSPDGRSILFVRATSRTNDDRIYVMRRDGSGVHPLRRDSLQQQCPRFSPDGRKISFWRGRDGQSGAYFVMNADGNGLRCISGGQKFVWGCPSWFPDSKCVVFTKDFSLYVASADGTHAKRLTHYKIDSLYRPAVSPDGRWLACDGSLHGWHGGNGIIVMRADGTGARMITRSWNEIQNDSGPAWSSDGKRIVFAGYRPRFRYKGV